MAEDWDCYFCRVNDALASIFLDLGLRESAPQPERPHLLWVWVYMLNPREDGLSSSEEAEQLWEIGHHLEATLAERLGALSVGRITTSGRREFYFYAPLGDRLDSTVQEALAKYPAYRYDCGEQSDPRWSQYLEVLYPDPIDWHRIQNRRVVETLKEHGDTLTTPREVDHFLYFASEESRQAFIAQVSGEGFTVQDLMADEEDNSGSRPFGLHICRRDRVDLSTIDTVVNELMDRANALGGEYDGWGAPVVREVPQKAIWNRLPWRSK